MCNDYRLMVELASVIEEFEHLKIKIRFPEGRPNIEAREDIKITDTAPIVRGIEGERGAGEQVAVSKDRQADLCHCRHLARNGRCRRGIHDVDDGAGARHCALS